MTGQFEGITYDDVTDQPGTFHFLADQADETAPGNAFLKMGGITLNSGGKVTGVSDSVSNESSSTLATSKAVHTAHSDGTRQATESTQGQTEIATQEETNAGKDDGRIVTPKKLKAWWGTVRSWRNITDKPSVFPAAEHNHDGRYYTESEIDTRLSAKLSLAGGIMTGNIEFADNGEGIRWYRNTDVASIKFYNTSDGDTDCRLEFHIADNGNEFFQWTARAGNKNEILMDLRPNTDNLTLIKGTVYVNKNQRVFAQNFHPNADKLTTARTISLSGDVYRISRV